MPAPVGIQESAVVSRRDSYYVRHVGMQAPDKIQGKRDDLATASGMTAEKKRYLMLKRAIRQAGRQEGQGDERRHGRGLRYDGMPAKKTRLVIHRKVKRVSLAGRHNQEKKKTHI